MIYNTSISSKEKRRFEIGNFKGVDLSSNKTDIAKTRASEMLNLINKNGLNRKRYGFVADSKPLDETTNKHIYGYFHSTLGGHDFKFVHLGDDLLLSYNNGEYKSILSNTLKLQSDNSSFELKEKTIVLTSTKGKMYEANERLYFVIGGQYLCFKRVDESNCSKFIIEDIFESEDTYIPLVVTNINSTTTTADKREALDEYNKLTRFVRYGLVGDENGTNQIEYALNKELRSNGFKIVLNQERSESGKVLSIPVKRTILKKDTVSLNEVGKVNKFIQKNDVLATLSGTNAIVSVYGAARLMNVGSFADNSNYTTPVSIFECTSGSDVYKIEIYFQAKEDTSQLNVLCDAYIQVKKNEEIHISPVKFNTLTLTGIFSKKTSIPIGFIKGFNFPDSSVVTKVHSSIDFTGSCYKYDYTYNLYFEDDSTQTVIGSMGNNGKIYFNSTKILKPAIEGNTNIFVYNQELDSLDKSFIQESVDSTLFGTNGANDRIFIAHKNHLYWTEFINNYYYEYPFTYISDMAYATVGAGNCNITALQKLNDSTLGVFKEEETNDSNFYAVTATSVAVEDFVINGNTYSIPAVKVIFNSANLPEILTTKDSLNVLGGDVLFASKNGIYAVKITDSINPQRTASERAKNINAVFNQYDLTGAKSIVWDNKYFLAVTRKIDNKRIIFVADSRYKYSESGNFDGAYNFEWYIWDNLDVQEWFIEDDNLCFFSKDNRKYVYQNDNSKEELRFVDYHFEESVTCTTSSNPNSPISINDSTLNKLKNYDEYFFMLKGDANALIAETTLDISYKVLYIREKENGFEVSSDKSSWFPYESISVGSSTKAYIYKYSNVKALYITGVFDLGANDMVKTLFGITMGVDHKTNGSVIVGYKTKYDNDVEIGAISSSANEMDLSAFGFNNLSFGNSFASSYSAKMKVRSFTYIQFLFASNNAEDFAVNNLVLSYKYNRNNKGVY